MRRFRFPLPTWLEAVFFAAAVAMAWHAVVPTLRRSRDAARVDLAARSLVECDRAVRHLLRTHVVRDPAAATLDMVERDRLDAGLPGPVWPAGTDRTSFDASGTNGCSIRVVLGDGTSVRVTWESNRVDHAN